MIDKLGGFLASNLIVFVAIVLLPLKWIVVRICRDHEAEAVALMSVPEDLCYVALGLVMGDMINSSGAFRKHFAPSTHISIDIAVTIGLNLGVALLIHRLSQACANQFRLWRAADSARSADKAIDPKQADLPLPQVQDNLLTIMLRHLFLFSIGYAVQLIVVLFWLHWVAKVVANT
jgi:hypothetical protein